MKRTRLLHDDGGNNGVFQHDIGLIMVMSAASATFFTMFVVMMLATTAAFFSMLVVMMAAPTAAFFPMLVVVMEATT